MEKYQFKIEDTIVTNPDGWKDFTLQLKRDNDISGLLTTSTNKFTFKKDGYAILKDRFDVNYNDKVKVSIDILQADNSYLEQYKGVVVLSNVTFNLEKRTAETIVIDASFQGAIQANKNIKSFVNSGFTKNGEATTAITVYNLDYFNNLGTYQSLANRRAYLLKDALDFLVRFMTDGEVKGIQSAYLDDVSNFDTSLPYITTGVSIRLASQDAPNVSFVECISFLQKTHDLTFDFITDTNGDPVMRIEEKAFFFQDTVQDTIRDIVDLKLKVDTQRIASHIEVGNNNALALGNCSSTTRWFSFQKEDYALRGKGNIDKLIDLTTDFVTSHNTIQAIIVSANALFDEDIFIILGNTGGTQATKFQSTSYCANLNIYNRGFTNDNIIGRHIESVPNSVSKYLTASTTPAKIGLNADSLLFKGNLFGGTTTYDKLRALFNNEASPFYDTGGNYFAVPDGSGNQSYYEVPFEGDFTFSYKLPISINAILAFGTGVAPQIDDQELDYTFTVSIVREDTTFTFIEKTTKIVTARHEPTNILKNFDGDVLQANILTIEDSTGFTCSTSDRISVNIKLSILARNIGSQAAFFETDVLKNPDGHFMCQGSDADAGTFKVFDPNSYKARLYTFEKNVSLTRSDAIRTNTRNSITINELSDTKFDKTTWIEEMVNNIETGETSFTMIN